MTDGIEYYRLHGSMLILKEEKESHMSSKFTKLVLTVTLILLLTIQASASIIVAAKDSVNRKKADYKCDGKDDQVEIQKAIDKLPASGGMVELLEGTFNFGDSIEITKSNVTLRGAGKSTVLKHIPTLWVKMTKDAKKGDIKITVENISQFRVGQIIGISDDNTNPPPEPGKPYPYYNGGYYIPSEIHTIKSISKKTITLDRGLENAMLMAKNSRVAPAWPMIKAYGNAETAVGKTNLELSDFAIDCNRDNVARVFHGYAHYKRMAQLREQQHYTTYISPPATILSELHHGEELTSAIYMEYAHNLKIKNLYIHDVTMSGIFLIDSNYALIEGNTIRDYGLKGYVNCFGDYSQIIGNLVENSANEDGIIVYARPAGYTIISNNIVRNCPRGNIVINQARRAVVTGNNVYGGGGGISVCSQEATITGNYIENSAFSGISVHIFPAWKIDPAEAAITIMGNSLRDNRHGLYLDNASNISLVGNSIAGSKENAIFADAKCNSLIISNNQLLNTAGSEASGIKLGGSDNFVFGNKVKGFKKGVWLEATAGKNVVERNGFGDSAEKILDEGKDNTIERNL